MKRNLKTILREVTIKLSNFYQMFVRKCILNAYGAPLRRKWGVCFWEASILKAFIVSICDISWKTAMFFYPVSNNCRVLIRLHLAPWLSSLDILLLFLLAVKKAPDKLANFPPCWQHTSNMHETRHVKGAKLCFRSFVLAITERDWLWQMTGKNLIACYLIQTEMQYDIFYIWSIEL